MRTPRIVGLSIVVVLVLALAQSAAAASWPAQTVPVPREYNTQLSAVSCASATACVAVGFYVNGVGHEFGIAETWNGTAWSVSVPVVPAGATSSRLTGISCTAANACTAVGTYASATHSELPVAERWNGSAWTAQTVALPSGASFVLLVGVSCTASNRCVAVGGYRGAGLMSATLTELWNGTSWAISPSPNPAGQTYSILNSVSCNATVCMAVGDAGSSQFPSRALAERFNGTSWTAVTIPAPAGSTAVDLGGVSCPTATSCVAAGGYATTGFFSRLTLAESWNGTSWTIKPTPNPNATYYATLGSVSCVTASNCTAVGEPDYVGQTTPIIQHWDGASWTTQTPATPPTKYGWLWGVSCSAAGCTAVGGGGSQSPTSVASALAERQPAGSATWSLQSTPNVYGGGSGDFYGVACVAGPSCLAVGDATSGTATLPLAGRWNGTSWTLLSPVAVKGDNFLHGAACSSASVCTVVGETDTPYGFPLAERWNGTTWTVESVPSPSGAFGTEMTAVACPSATFCVATGSTQGNGTHAVLWTWNGTSWSLVAVPEPSGTQYSGLSAVSCSQPGACMAVGGYANNPSRSNQQPLVERLAGGTWTSQSVPVPAGTVFAALSGVSCTSPAPCTAVGGYSTTNAYGATNSLIERFNGSTWAMQTPSEQGALSADACPTLTACQAITGSSAQGWNGTTWTPEADPNSGYQYGVACATATACELAGYNSSDTVADSALFAGVQLANVVARPQANGLSSTPSAGRPSHTSGAPAAGAVRTILARRG